MSNMIEFRVPDIGDFQDVPIIEVSVEAGQTIAVDDIIVILESDKATLEVPSDVAGEIIDIKVAEGDRVSENSVLVTISSNVAEGSNITRAAPSQAPRAPVNPELMREPEGASTLASAPGAPASASLKLSPTREGLAYASPSIRKFARELGADISRISGSGIKGRITREDVTAFVKNALSSPSPGSNAGLGLGLPDWPKVDYEKFGPVVREPLSRIAKISGPALARNSIIIPHVTNFENADITEVEDFRKSINAQSRDCVRMSILSFIVKAMVVALKEHPKFNSSLDGDHLVLKQYYHIGVAVDTPGGLVVPVIKDADQKGLREIAIEMTDFAEQARSGKLKPTDMQGGTFTISSLGGIGGANFTPIINAPEVAIFGMVRSSIQPVWDGQTFQPRLIQPMSLSWDHRVVDGVAAGRFLVTVKDILADFRRISL